jgi:hypothetical protein
VDSQHADTVKQWHELKLVQGKNIKGYLDGKLYLEHALSEPVSGRIGLWSKADSVCILTTFVSNRPAETSKVMHRWHPLNVRLPTFQT